ncbi:hypothetical protein D3C79_1048670 [compost metagenome]
MSWYIFTFWKSALAASLTTTLPSSADLAARSAWALASNPVVMNLSRAAASLKMITAWNFLIPMPIPMPAVAIFM